MYALHNYVVMHGREMGIDTMMHMRYFVRIAWILNAFQAPKTFILFKSQIILAMPKSPSIPPHIAQSISECPSP